LSIGLILVLAVFFRIVAYIGLITISSPKKATILRSDKSREKSMIMKGGNQDSLKTENEPLTGARTDTINVKIEPK